MSKLLSKCCQAPAKVNVLSGGYFCVDCGNNCAATETRSGLTTRSTLSAVRKPTGERELFIELWAKCGGKSQVSGLALPDPASPLFHHCGSHLLEKGSYPDYRLDSRNVVMMTPEEHTRWHSLAPSLRLADSQFGKFEVIRQNLKREAHRKGKAIEDSDNDAAQLMSA